MIFVFAVILTISTYWLSRIVGAKYPTPFTTPVFFSTTIIIITLLMLDIDYGQYMPARKVMSYLLGPATVALAVPLYKTKDYLIRYMKTVLTGVFVGSISAMVSAVLLANLFNLGDLVISSALTISVTIPIGIEVAKVVGGDPSLAAAFIVGAGTTGTMMGPMIMNFLGINNPLARGLTLGTASHGQGTAYALTEGELSGAMAGIAMAIAGIVIAFVGPYFFFTFID